MLDPATLGKLPPSQTTKGTPIRSGSDIGACFQLALLAAAQSNDQEAGGYLRQIITSMKSMVQPGGADAEASPSP